MKDQKNMYQRKTRHEKSRRIIYKFSYKMGVLNEKRCKNNIIYQLFNLKSFIKKNNLSVENKNGHL